MKISLILSLQFDGLHLLNYMQPSLLMKIFSKNIYILETLFGLINRFLLHGLSRLSTKHLAPIGYVGEKGSQWRESTASKGL